MAHRTSFLIAIFILIIGNLIEKGYADTISVPAYVNIKFSTTVNVKKRGIFDENTGATEFVFLMKENLYKPLDSLKPYPATSLSIDDIKISAPALTGTENVDFSIRMAYKEPSDTSVTPLLYANTVSSSNMKTGSFSRTKETGFSTFNSILQSDITNPSSRKLNYLLFEIKVKVDGPAAATIDLDHLDFQFDLNASVTTKVDLLE